MKSITTRKTSVINFIIWAIAGLVTWLAGLFLFSYALYGVVFSTVSFLKAQNLPQIIIGTGSLIAFNLADLSIALLATIVLSRFTGFKLLWLVAFFIAANFIKIELLIGTLLEYQSSNVSGASWTTAAFVQNTIAVFLCFPAVSLVGCLVGNCWRKKRLLTN